MVDEVSEFYTAKRLSTSSASHKSGPFPTGEGLDMCEQTAVPFPTDTIGVILSGV